VLGYIRTARYFDAQGAANPNPTPDFLIGIAEGAAMPSPDPDPPKAPARVEPVESIPMEEPSPIDPTLPPKPIEKSRTGKAINRKSRGQETMGITTIGAIITAIAMQVEVVGKTIESLETETLLKVGGIGLLCLFGFGAWMWWSGRNEAWLARHHPDGTPRIQDPKY